MRCCHNALLLCCHIALLLCYHNALQSQCAVVKMHPVTAVTEVLLPQRAAAVLSQCAAAVLSQCAAAVALLMEAT
eukprot:720078-Pelagomonas_calceolata.AAC.1